MKKIIIISIFLIAGLFIDSRIFCFAKDTDILSKRPQEDKYCFDFANVVPVEVVREINTQGEGLRRHFDIDFVVVIMPSLELNTINEYAADLFSNWQIGKDTQGKKGILILIAMKEQQIKIEVGYDLEQIYTDMYVGQVEREMLKEFLEQADWERGFLATIENFVERTYRMYKKGLDVKGIASQGKEEYYSGGAGAKNVFDFGAALKKPLPNTSKELREYFNAQPTPALAFQRYMELCARNISDYALDLFSDSSKEFFSHWKTSAGQRRSEAETSSEVPYVVKEKGKYAVVLFPCDDDIEEFIQHPPYFFIRTEKGWQIDINTMSRSMTFGGPTWHFLSTEHPYMFAFKGYLIKMNRCYPLRGQKAFLGLNYSLWGNQNKGLKIIPEWDSPAKKAGIKEGDILVSINGEKITQPYQDWEIMKRYNPGDTVNVVVIRDGKEINTKAVLEGAKSHLDEFPYVRKVGDPWTGFYFGYSEPYERDIEDVQLSVLYVVENSPADKAGFKAGDLIYYIPGSRDRHVGFYDYKELLKRLKPTDKVKLKVLRNLKDRIELTLEIGNYSLDKEGI